MISGTSPKRSAATECPVSLPGQHSWRRAVRDTFKFLRFPYLFFGLIPELVFPSWRLSGQFPEFISADADTLLRRASHDESLE